MGWGKRDGQQKVDRNKHPREVRVVGGWGKDENQLSRGGKGSGRLEFGRGRVGCSEGRGRGKGLGWSGLGEEDQLSREHPRVGRRIGLTDGSLRGKEFDQVPQGVDGRVVG